MLVGRPLIKDIFLDEYLPSWSLAAKESGLGDGTGRKNTRDDGERWRCGGSAERGETGAMIDGSDILLDLEQPRETGIQSRASTAMLSWRQGLARVTRDPWWGRVHKIDR